MANLTNSQTMYAHLTQTSENRINPRTYTNVTFVNRTLTVTAATAPVLVVPGATNATAQVQLTVPDGVGESSVTAPNGCVYDSAESGALVYNCTFDPSADPAQEVTFNISNGGELGALMLPSPAHPMHIACKAACIPEQPLRPPAFQMIPQHTHIAHAFLLSSDCWAAAMATLQADFLDWQLSSTPSGLPVTVCSADAAGKSNVTVRVSGTDLASASIPTPAGCSIATDGDVGAGFKEWIYECDIISPGANTTVTFNAEYAGEGPTLCPDGITCFVVFSHEQHR